MIKSLEDTFIAKLNTIYLSDMLHTSSISAALSTGECVTHLSTTFEANLC